MTHLRAQIRAQAKALLHPLPTTGNNVYVGRTWPTGTDVLPAIMVYTLDEPSLDAAVSGRRQQRTLTLKVEGRAMATDDEALLDTLDAIAFDVETALLASGAFGALIIDIMLGQTVTNTAASTDMRAGEIEMTFHVEYFTAAGAPGAALP